jgi:NADPH-dependent 2,4-dienoyl-CoA reductase/sulfur reductase-like enzyme/rhodanese-related sulfurtransferase
MPNRQKIVVVGGVAAGPKTAARLRRLLPDAQITIIERGNMLSYAGCGMPYCIAGDMPDCNQLNYSSQGIPRDAVFFRQVKDIDVLVDTVAESIDREHNTVHIVSTETGESRDMPYDKLVLSTGGIHVTPPIDGIKLNRVFQLSRPSDAINIRDLVTSGAAKNAVLIGGGLIGMEVADAFVRRGLQVTIVEMLPRVLSRLLDDETAAFLTKYLRSEGVDIRTSERVMRLEGDAHGNVSKVVTDRGEIKTDMVLVSVGVRPNSQLGKDAGLEVGETGGIAVDEFMQTSDPDIYAAGDVVETVHLVSGRKTYAPMGSTANKQGRVIANHIAGIPDTFKGVTGTAVVKVLEYNVGKTGLTEEEARAAGYDVVVALNPGTDKAHFYPDHAPAFLKMIADRETGRVLGMQAVGRGEGIKRIDVVATALQFGATVDDIAALDLGYAPPYAGAVDLVAHTANIIRNKISGIAASVTPAEVKAKLDQGEDFVWLDVRSPAEFEADHIDDPRVKLIPLGNLRKRLNELPEDKEIVVFCQISLRAYEAHRILRAASLDAKFMDGGIVAWPYEKTGFVPLVE